MPRDYSTFLTDSFKLFSLKTAPRTALPTLRHFVFPHVLAKSDKPVLVTMNILPALMTVWHHFALRSIGDRADIVIFDCSGRLKQNDLPGTYVQPFLNLYAATKVDIALRSFAKNRRSVWICDDDVLLTGKESFDSMMRELQVPNTACVTMEPRDWWQFEMNGQRIAPAGTYCLAINRDIVCDKEHLSFKPTDGNEHPSLIPGRPVKRYDTFDKANEILLQKGYRCAAIDEMTRKNCTIGYDGLSGAVMLLYRFKTPDETMAYLEEPSNEAWGGTILFRVLNGMLAIDTLSEAAEKISGASQRPHALPSRSELQKLRQSREKFLREGLSFTLLDENREELFARLS